MWFDKPQLALLPPSFPTALEEKIGAFFTLREGGVSSGPYGNQDGIMGLNVGAHVGDVGACVTMNRSIVTQLLPSEPKWLTQVHGVTVVHADEATPATQADASWTTTPGVVCAVMVADCLPVLFTDAAGGVVAAAHAGWRSLADGVLQATVAVLREHAKGDLYAWMGPSIGANDFEVGPEVRERAVASCPAAEGAFRQGENGREYCDLHAWARAVLKSVGVEHVTEDASSTYADKARFYSYRRDGERSGRHVAVIWRKPAESKGE